MWEQWIEQYGPLAIFFGAILEGEAVLILAGYAIARGYLDPASTLLLATAGGTTGDSLYFWIGRSFGAKLIRNRRRLRPLRARATLFIRRRGHSAAFLTRFAFGLRTVLPMLIGAIRMRPVTFHLFNALAALVFAGVYLVLGYLFGQALEELLGRMRSRETMLIVGVLGLGVVAWLIREWQIYHSSAPGRIRRDRR